MGEENERRWLMLSLARDVQLLNAGQIEDKYKLYTLGLVRITSICMRVIYWIGLCKTTRLHVSHIIKQLHLKPAHLPAPHSVSPLLICDSLSGMTGHNF